MNKIKCFALAAVAVMGLVSVSSCSEDDSNDPKKDKVIDMKGTPIKYGDATNVIWTDATVFNNEIYSLVVSLDKSGAELIEKYELYKSKDAQTWTKVDYTVDGAQGLIGGEGARLAVLNNKLVVWGGLRSKGADVYGGAAEITQGWTGPAPTATFRVYTSENGVDFTASTPVLKRGETELPATLHSMYAQPFANVVVYNGKLVVNGGFMIAYGMMQPARQLLVSEDLTNFEVITAVDAEGNTINLPNYLSCMYEVGGKLFVGGGMNNFISASYIQNVAYSTTDLTTWTLETAAEGSEFPALYEAKVISNGTTALLLGGEQITDEGSRSVDPIAYKSTDGVNWTKTDVPENFTGYRLTNAVVKKGYAYILGGYTTPTVGSYAGPADEDEYATNAWTVALK